MAELSLETLDEFRNNFINDGKLKLAQNVCTKHGPMETCRNRSAEQAEISHVFNHKVESEGKPITNQKSSGRCWIFACLNVIRLPFTKSLNIEEFEFSQSYLFFWDKIERMNFALNSMVDIVRKGEKPDGRLMSHLLFNPAEDGGQWAMLVNLINKYGLLPKKNFPDSNTSELSTSMNRILNSYIRDCSQKIHDLFSSGDPGNDKVNAELKKMSAQVYKIVSICLGTPPKEFVWEYYDKDKKYNKIGPLSPLDFYSQYVKPHYNVDDKICVVNDPRETSPYNKLYTVDYLNNMVGAGQVLYINLPVEDLKKMAVDSIKGNEALWFGCDVGKHLSWKKLGIQDFKLYDFENVFGYVPNLGISKAQRLERGDSMMTHAMVLTAVHLNEDGKSTKWRVENSWSKDGGEDGYLVMSDDWFTEFTYELVVDKKYVPEAVQKVLEEKPIVLPAWDPMGTLAA